MKSTVWKSLFVLTATVAVLMLGCSDEDSSNPPAAAPRVVGVWDADSASEAGLGIQQLTYYFYSDYTYRYYRIAPPAIDETGTWAFSGALNDSIAFHATLRDSVAIDENYTWRYDIVEGTTQAGDVLHMWMFLDPGYFEALLPRTQ